MRFKEMCRAVCDFWRPNRRSLRKYLLQDGQKHPVAIICPGGGYSMVCSFVEGAPFAEQLNKQGFHAVVVYYRCKRKARYPAPMDDLAWAVKEVLAHAEEWNIDPAGYSVWGSSAGGHLAASFGTESLGYAAYALPKPGALVLCYPVITMGPLTHADSRKNLLGRAPTAEETDRFSIEKQVTAAYPPTFVWCGAADTLVPPQNSRLLFAAVQQNGVSCQLKQYPNTGHGVGLGQNLPCAGWFDEAVRFWQQARNAGQCLQKEKSGRKTER